jgi:hypothetical protein
VFPIGMVSIPIAKDPRTSVPPAPTHKATAMPSSTAGQVLGMT